MFVMMIISAGNHIRGCQDKSKEKQKAMQMYSTGAYRSNIKSVGGHVINLIRFTVITDTFSDA